MTTEGLRPPEGLADPVVRLPIWPGLSALELPVGRRLQAQPPGCLSDRQPGPRLCTQTPSRTSSPITAQRTTASDYVSPVKARRDAAIGIVLMVGGAAVLVYALVNRRPQPTWIDLIAGVGIGLIGVGSECSGRLSSSTEETATRPSSSSSSPSDAAGRERPVKHQVTTECLEPHAGLADAGLRPQEGRRSPCIS
jgi:hypothetical protein